ncbi:Alpha/beta hydrolase fold-1 [Phyllosticta citribraziliensis]|uniref:Alpha/beta hydrolase fold-1 n=1 Tax=Phyllosticta citribraziliensis TaxID=989973 RepID=A0ABR1LQA7_9PEZI
MSKPVIVLAPGAWHTPDCFDIVRDQLHARGWTTDAVAYPSVGGEPPNKSLPDDAAAVRAKLETLADQGQDIVLVVHSYGGLVGANAVEGLGYEQRKRAGKKGGVIMFVYLSAFVTPKGKSIKDMLGGQFLPWMKFNGDYCTPDTPEQIFYHDVEPAQQAAAISKLKHTSAAVFSSPVTYEPWHDMPTFFLYCDADAALPLPVQDQFVSLLGAGATTFHSKGSHSPFLSVPEEVVEGLELAVKTGLEKKSS